MNALYIPQLDKQEVWVIYPTHIATANQLKPQKILLGEIGNAELGRESVQELCVAAAGKDYFPNLR